MFAPLLAVVVVAIMSIDAAIDRVRARLKILRTRHVTAFVHGMGYLYGPLGRWPTSTHGFSTLRLAGARIDRASQNVQKSRKIETR